MIAFNKKHYSIIVAAFSIVMFMLQSVSAQNINTPNKVGPMGVEVNTKTGNLFFDRTDLYLPGRQIGMDISFSYNSYDFDQNSGYGNGWTFMYNIRYKIDSLNNVIIIWGDGREDTYTNKNGQFNAPVGFFDSLSQYQSGKYLLRTKEGLKLYFDNATHKRLTKASEPNGNFLSFGYTDTLMTSISNNSGQSLVLSYAAGNLNSITDANASPVQTHNYSYDAYGNLVKVTDPQGGTYKYTYLVNGPLSTITDKNNNVVDLIYYSDFSAREIVSCNSRTSFSYDTTTRTTTVIDFVPTASNQTTTYLYNEKGWLSKFIGSCCGMNITFTYDNNGNLIERKDANGNVYKYTYDNRGNYLTITDPLNNVTSFSYTADFNEIAGITDPLGNAYNINYDAAGNPIQITRPGNQQQTLTYNGNGDLLSIKDANNNTTNITYDAFGFPQKISMPLNTEVQTSFDARGNLVSGKDANGNSYSFQYDSLNQLKTVTDPLNRNVSFTYDKAGNLTSFTDAKGMKQLISYDASNRVVSYKDQKGAVSSFAYDAMDNLIQFTDALGKTTSLAYDNQNRLSSITDAVGNGYNFNYDLVGNMVSAKLAGGNTMNFTYDQLNRIVSGSDDVGSLGSLTYDKNGNATSFTNAEGSAIQLSYDNLNRVVKITDPLGNSRAFTYDNNDNLLTLKDRNNHISSYTYNALNRITSFTDNNNNTISAQYDSYGNITSVTDQNGNITTYQYDALNRPFKLNYPDGSNIVATYDANNNITALKQADGSTINYTYDSTNRLITKDLPGGEHFAYSYDSKGRLVSASNSAGLLAFAYDDVDRILMETFNSHITSYSYNLPARVASTIYPDGTIITKTFDKRLRLNDLSMNNQQLASYQYNSIDQLIQKNFANGITTSYHYDVANRLSSISSNNNTLPSLSFQYDNEGNKTVVARSNDPQYSETFTYDANYRLINYKQGVMNGNTISSPLVQNRYTYDHVGDRTSAGLNGLNTTYSVNNLNQYTASNNSNQNINFTYDGNGNQTYNGNFYMRYDAEGRKIADSSVGNVYHYQYDALGRRVLKSINGVSTNYYYAGLKQIEERNSNDSVTGKQIFETAFKPLVRMNNNRKYFYHLNDLHSTEAITDSTGNLIEHYRYEDFGKVSFYNAQNNNIASSGINTNFLYTGQEYDAQTNSYNFHFRNYNPSTGSFNQRDPIGYADQMGMYQYVGNNPESYVDFLGLGTECSENKKEHGKEEKESEEKEADEFMEKFLLRLRLLKESPEYIHELIEKLGIKSLEHLDLFKNASELTKATAKGIGTTAGIVNNAILGPVETAFDAQDFSGNFENRTATQNVERGSNLALDVSEGTIGTALTLNGISALGGGGALIEVPQVAVPLVAGVGGYKIANGISRAVDGKSLVERDLFVLPGNTVGKMYGDIQSTIELSHIIDYQSENGRWEKWMAAQRQRDAIIEYFKTHKIQKPNCPQNGNNNGNENNRFGHNYGQHASTEGTKDHDPNFIVGPDGVQTKKWVSVNDRLPYTILFENDTTANAPVKVVKVFYPIDPKQDASTFQLGSFGFNNLTFTIPDGGNSYYQRLDVRDSLGLYVDVTAGLDGVNHQAFWIFESIDPITQLPTTDPLKGFLLTRDAANPTSGNGFVNFSIKPLNTDHTGDSMSAYASIVFDSNDTIPTNRAFNTIDALPPTAHLNPVAQTIVPGTFKLSWHGNDDAGGSGLASYSLYVSPNGAPFSLYKSNIIDTSFIFKGTTDTTYCFFIAGVDSVKNEQPLSNNCDISLRSPGGSAPLPVTWLDFVGTRRDNDALLFWSTSNEINTKVFIVERSLNGASFTTIGTVNASGNTNNIHNYNFTDPNITSLGVTVIYYRIKEVDANRKFSYSKIAAIRVDKIKGPLITAFPNPFDHNITLKVIPVTNSDQTNIVELYSIQGVLLYKKDIGKTGTNTTELTDLPNLTSGVYILKTMVDGIQYSSKMVKK